MEWYPKYTIPAGAFLLGVGATLGWSKADKVLFKRKLKKVFDDYSADDPALIEQVVTVLRQRDKKLNKDEARAWAVVIIQVASENNGVDDALIDRLARAMAAAQARIKKGKKGGSEAAA